MYDVCKYNTKYAIFIYIYCHEAMYVQVHEHVSSYYDSLLLKLLHGFLQTLYSWCEEAVLMFPYLQDVEGILAIG